MYEALSNNEKQRVNAIVDGFDIRQKIGQTFCIRTGNRSAGAPPSGGSSSRASAREGRALKGAVSFRLKAGL